MKRLSLTLCILAFGGNPVLAEHQAKLGVSTREIIFFPDPNLGGISRMIQDSVNALDARGGGRIVLAAGKYKLGGGSLSNAVSLKNRRNIEFEGFGYSTSFEPASDSGMGIDAMFDLDHSENITFRGIRFRGLALAGKDWRENADVHEALLIRNGAKAIRILDCHFERFRTGAIEIQSTVSRVEVRGCFFDSVANKAGNRGDYGAIHINGGEEISISECFMRDLPQSGITAYAGGRILIINNQIRLDPNSKYTMGIHVLRGIGNSVISGNLIYDAWNEAIVIGTGGGASGCGTVHDLIVSGNVLKAKYIGVALYNTGCPTASGKGIVINGNAVERPFPPDSVSHGIFIQRTDGAVVSENTVKGFGFGINVRDNSDNNSITGNVVDGSVRVGILLHGRGIVSGNQILNSRVGVECGYAKDFSITGNLFTGVTVKVDSGHSAPTRPNRPTGD